MGGRRGHFLSAVDMANRECPKQSIVLSFCVYIYINLCVCVCVASVLCSLSCRACSLLQHQGGDVGDVGDVCVGGGSCCWRFEERKKHQRRFEEKGG